MRADMQCFNAYIGNHISSLVCRCVPAARAVVVISNWAVTNSTITVTARDLLVLSVGISKPRSRFLTHTRGMYQSYCAHLINVVSSSFCLHPFGIRRIAIVAAHCEKANRQRQVGDCISVYLSPSHSPYYCVTRYLDSETLL